MTELTAITSALDAAIVARGQPGTYRRGADSVPIAKMILTSPQNRQDNNQELRISHKRHDVLCPTEDIVIGSEELTPQLGDIVTFTGSSTVYRVTQDDTGQCWRWSHPATRTVRRIFVTE